MKLASNAPRPVWVDHKRVTMVRIRKAESIDQTIHAVIDLVPADFQATTACGRHVSFNIVEELYIDCSYNICNRCAAAASAAAGAPITTPAQRRKNLADRARRAAALPPIPAPPLPVRNVEFGSLDYTGKRGCLRGQLDGARYHVWVSVPDLVPEAVLYKHPAQGHHDKIRQLQSGSAASRPIVERLLELCRENRLLDGALAERAEAGRRVAAAKAERAVAAAIQRHAGQLWNLVHRIAEPIQQATLAEYGEQARALLLEISLSAKDQETSS